MKTINCLVVDDDEIFVENLEVQLKKLPFIQIVEKCNSYGETLIALQNSASIDFILLDVFLNNQDDLTGFDILRHHQNIPPVIIISHAPENAIESYNIGKAVDFLVKPFSNDRLLLAINRALGANTIITTERKFVFFKMGRQFQKYYLDDIEYFEGYGTYTKLKLTDESTHIINETLVQLDKILDTKNFIRVHKSYIINLNKLVGFDNNKLFTKNETVPIGETYKNKIEGLLKLFDNTFDLN